MDEKNVPAETYPHTVTAEDLKNNPELAEEGVKEGDEIGIPVQEDEGQALTGQAETNE